MSFDPKSVLNKIRSKRKSEKSNISESPTKIEEQTHETADFKNDKSRDEHTTQTTLHIMAEQIRYMQDHIKRLENQLHTANTEISKLKIEKDMLEKEKEKDKFVMANRSSRETMACFSKSRKRNNTPVGGQSKSFLHGPKRDSIEQGSGAADPCAHSSNGSRDKGGYLGMFASNKSRAEEEKQKQLLPPTPLAVHNPNIPNNYSSNAVVSPAKYSSKSDIRVQTVSDAPELRLDILEKILSLDTRMAIPHVHVVY